MILPGFTGRWRLISGHFNPALGAAFPSRLHAFLRAFVLPGMVVALLACSSPPAATPVAHVVHLAAPGSTLTLLHDLVDAYQQTAPPGITFDLRPNNSQVAVQALHTGTADLALSSWLTSTDLPGLAVVPVAWDAAAVVVHPRNPITNVTLLQLRNLYRGHTLDWSAFGGSASEATVISREEGSGVRAAFEHAVMNDQPVTLGAVVMPNDAAVIDFVASRPAAIGYVSLLGLTTAASLDEPPAQVKTLPVEGVVPNAADLLQGGYHLVHPLYLLARQPVAAPVQSFIDFVLSPAGQAVVAQHTTRVRR